MSIFDDIQNGKINSSGDIANSVLKDWEKGNWSGLSARERFDKLAAEYEIYDLLKNASSILKEIKSNKISQKTQDFLQKFSAIPDQRFIQLAIKFYPIIRDIINAYAAYVKYLQNELNEADGTTASQRLADEYMKAFTKPGQPPFISALSYMDTQQHVVKELNKHVRHPVPPVPIFPWEMRIGAARFVVPPININVSQSYKVGSLTGSALRQKTSPKFNAGYSETAISMTLYFPNHESIWGVSDAGNIPNGDVFIDFNADGNEEEVDKFLSSLRGLITQFKYAPFLPIRNQYINSAYNITGVVMHSMTISTLDDFPFCVAVTLNLLKFNHKAYLPMIDDFYNAIHWGKFRQYMGRAAQRTISEIGKGFLIQNHTMVPINKDTPTDAFGNSLNANNDFRDNYDKPAYENPDPPTTFNNLRDWSEGKNFDLYYPMRSPLKVFAPDIADFRQEGENGANDQRSQNLWEAFLLHLGVNVDTSPYSVYEKYVTTYTTALQIDQKELKNQSELLREFLKSIAAGVDSMTQDKLVTWKDYRLSLASQDNTKPLTQSAIDLVNDRSELLWYNYILNNFTNSPYFQTYLKNAQFMAGSNLLIHEWEVPMTQMELDWNNVIVNGISVSLANSIARMQLQMQDEPVYQHIGGKDSQVDVSLTVFGENDLIRLRRVFEHLNGLARLEHAHGVLGFFGIKNLMTALCGIKYLMPLSFEVDTIPGFPRVYSVRMSFTDFDIFQQKREQLSSDQQKELIEAFSKRNPFLRIKQVWGAFNAYPDFPLSVKDDKGKIVGHLDPDFYFKAFQTIDDDIIANSLRGGGASGTADEQAQAAGALFGGQAQIDRNTNAITAQEDTSPGLNAYKNVHTIEDLTTSDYNHKVLHHLGPLADKATDNHFIEIHKEGISLGSSSVVTGQKKYSSQNLQLQDDVPSKTLTTPNITTMDSTPFAKYGGEYVDGSTNPNKQLQMMMLDTQYRDITGRMVRAFPTYMLWLIDEGGNFAGIKLFDNFYGLQSVIDFSIVQSEDILGDTLVLRISNLYSKLDRRLKGTFFVDPKDTTGTVIDNVSSIDRTSDGTAAADSSFTNPDDLALSLLVDFPRDRQRNLESGLFDTSIVEIENIRLRPGVRVHMRMGYSANPNSLPTVFNGIITQVETGEIITVTAQSDAIELSPMINTNDKKGHSGSINEGFMGALWLSEPRDLMVRLLSMGASSAKELISHAFGGMVFSESRFGIRHFGQMLWEPLSDAEEKKNLDRRNIIQNGVDNITNSRTTPQAVGAGAGFFIDPTQAPSPFFGTATAITRAPAGQLMASMFSHLAAKRDLEIFKRNIYPGNGLGVAQYMGGDLVDGGIHAAVTNELVQQLEQNLKVDLNATSEIQKVIAEGSSDQKRISDENKVSSANNNTTHGNALSALDNTVLPGTGQFFNAIVGHAHLHPFLQALGVEPTDDDLKGYDEISFRAQTYMKSVWDMFQLCAALLPNYIVSVRPFMERSTVFYGKPHWLYTSGVVPLTTGIPKAKGLNPEKIDKVMAGYLRQAAELANPLSDAEAEIDSIKRLTNVGVYNVSSKVNAYGSDGTTSQTTTTSAAGGSGDGSGGGGTPLSASETAKFKELPLDWNGKQLLTQRKNVIVMEMHLPTNSDLKTDIKQHIQLSSLPPNLRHPYFMDRAGGARGGASTGSGDKSIGTGTVLGEDPNAGGAGGWMYGANVPPKIEQWYINQYWASNVTRDDLRNRRIIVMNADNGQACICAVGDKGPSPTTKFTLGASPDVMKAIGANTGNNNIYIGFVRDDAALGPVINSYESGIQGSTIQDKKVPQIGPKVTKDNQLDTSAINSWYDSDAKKKEDQPAIYEAQYGALDTEVPVYIDPSSGLYSGLDSSRNVGYVARLLYDVDFAKKEREAHPDDPFIQNLKYPGTLFGGRTLKNAQDIWSQLRHEFDGWDPVDDSYKKWTEIYNKHSPQFTIDSNEFKKFLWNNGFNRAWVVIVTDKKIHGITSWDSAVAEKIKDFFGDKDAGWDFHKVEGAWDEWVKAEYSGGTSDLQAAKDAASAYMQAHATEGYESNSKIGRILEGLDHLWKNTVGKLITAVSAGISGLISLFRTSLQQLGQGLDLAGQMQAQSNLLNKVFNDSIYYAAGSEGSILRMADNPFTREYAEPVVEVREPFQRMHYINSFQHIINNGIIENGNIATVVTATSDGKYPVTVHFDKGAPAERQTEITAETGLFWDNARGSGLTGILHPLFHPIETARGIEKAISGSSDELLSKRVALWHLKESLKDIYGGEVITLGNPDIRPHDLVYIADVYQRLYGMFEVEQIVHHFTPDEGFISSITPNALVTINDPARWSMMSWAWSWWGVKNLRDDVRSMLDIQADISYANFENEISPAELAQSLETQFKGHVQYTQGASALVKDLAGSAKMGMVQANSGQVHGNAAVGLGALAAQSIPIIGEAGWDAWKWVRDNLLDQHGCYIQYLNKDGKPMDAGLSYNQGVAVGRHHSINLLPGILGAKINTIEGGNKRITTNDLLQALGWKEIEVSGLVKDVSFWNAYVNDQVLQLAGKSPDEIAFTKPIVEIGRAVRVIDGDTMYFQPDGGGPERDIRLAGINSPELQEYDKLNSGGLVEIPGGDVINVPGDDIVEANSSINSNRARLAREYLVSLVMNSDNEGDGKVIALRYNRDKFKDVSEKGTRWLGVIFADVPDGIDGDRGEILRALAEQWPLIPWDSYMDNGRPYTVNWAMATSGLALIYTNEVSFNNPDEGAVGQRR